MRPSDHRLDAALAQYDLPPAEATPVVSGLMHGTWKVEAGGRRYAFQRLHHKLATPEIVDDYVAVTGHLAAKGVPAPELVPTAAGSPVATVDGTWWRLSTWLDGDTRMKVTTAAEAYAGARMLGRFHRAMADIEHTFGSQHPLHDTRGHLARLEAAAADPAHAAALETIAPQVERIRALLPPLILPETLPRRVVHGDPKISNVLFAADADPPRAVGMIDLDTCNRHTVLVDLGDAVRSWCRDGGEDEEERFHIDRFEAILAGYAETGPPLTAAEVALLPGAGRLITLELASRFARDVLEDEYFAFDATRYPDRRSHNRARTRSMLFLAADMHAQRAQAEALVKRHLDPDRP